MGLILRVCTEQCCNVSPGIPEDLVARPRHAFLPRWVPSMLGRHSAKAAAAKSKPAKPLNTHLITDRQKERSAQKTCWPLQIETAVRHKRRCPYG